MKDPKVIEIVYMRNNSEFSESRVEEAKNLIAQMILLGREDGPKRSRQKKLKCKAPFDPRGVITNFDQKSTAKLLKSGAAFVQKTGDHGKD